MIRSPRTSLPGKRQPQAPGHLIPASWTRRPCTLAIASISTLTTSLLADPADVSANLAPFLQNGKVPALAAAAVLDGKIIAAGATGVRKHGDPTPVTVKDQFHIG